MWVWRFAVRHKIALEGGFFLGFALCFGVCFGVAKCDFHHTPYMVSMQKPTGCVCESM
jgi:glutamine amidotransferase-like uncharacterized protein